MNAHPVWLDEMCHWRSLLSWDQMGFDTGYYGMMEDVAPIGRLGISGLGPILIYGWFVKLFGLTNHTIVLANAVWISIAAAVFCWIRKPRPAVSFTLAAFTMTYAPMVLYCLTSMTECFNYALMLLYLAFLLAYQEKRCLWALIMACITVIFACLYRPMYAVLFIPLVLFFSRYRFGWRMVLSSLIALALSAAAGVAALLTSAPNAQGFLHHLMRAADLPTFIQMLLSHTKSNLIDFFIRPTHSPMQDAFRWMYCILTLLCLAGSLFALERKPRWRIRPGFRPPFFSCFMLLAAAFGLTVMLYETNAWLDYWRLAPYLWLVIAFFVTRWRFTIPAISLTASTAALVLLLSLPPVGAFSETERLTAPAADPGVTEIAQAVVFDEDASDPFDNTVRIDVYNYQLMQELHPGLGLQYGWFVTETTGQSRWILTDRLKCPVTDYESVLDTGSYKLYRKIEEN